MTYNLTITADVKILHSKLTLLKDELLFFSIWKKLVGRWQIISHEKKQKTETRLIQIFQLSPPNVLDTHLDLNCI